MVAPFPRFFAAGSTLNKAAVVPPSPEPPLQLPHAAGKLCQEIDWRVCGDQDAQPLEEGLA